MLLEAALNDMLEKADLGCTVDDLRAHPEGIEIPGGNKDIRKYESGKIRKDGKPGFSTRRAARSNSSPTCFRI